MPTYVTHDAEGNRRPVALSKPRPAHTLTESAESARQSVRDHAQRLRSRITRAEVEAAYVHPEPEEPAHEVELGVLEPFPDRRDVLIRTQLEAAGARRLAKAALLGGHRVKATRNRGTTVPKWHVNAPDSKPNPGPPVAADQYHGTLVTVETVYVVPVFDGRDLFKPKCAPGRIKGVWQNGRIDRVEVDGVATTLEAALEVLS